MPASRTASFQQKNYKLVYHILHALFTQPKRTTSVRALSGLPAWPLSAFDTLWCAVGCSRLRVRGVRGSVRCGRPPLLVFVLPLSTAAPLITFLGGSSRSPGDQRLRLIQWRPHLEFVPASCSGATRIWLFKVPAPQILIKALAATSCCTRSIACSVSACT